MAHGSPNAFEGCIGVIEIRTKQILEELMPEPKLRRVFSRFPIRITSVLALYLMTLPDSANCGQPEYMKLDFEQIPAVEIKGHWDTTGAFVATDISQLPKPRRPKLRGPIQGINKNGGFIVMYGITIEIDEDTQFPGADSGISSLKIGQRVEVSCKVRDKIWEAKKISIGDIKDSDKIKGTITNFSIDGVAPDTIEISGLIIILNEKTDVDDPTGFINPRETDLFKDLVFSNSLYSIRDDNSGRTLKITTDYRQTIKSEQEYDLYDLFPSDYRDAEPDLRLESAGFWNQSLRSFFQLRLRKRIIIDNERVPEPSSKFDPDISQLYILATNLGVTGLTAQIGRQDFDEPREWLFDEYLDALRVYYYGREPLVLETAYIHSSFSISDQYNTWTDLFAQARWYLNKKSFIRSYILKRSDSDITRKREPVYYGIGYSGHIIPMIDSWAEFSVLRGHDKGKTQKADALDLGIVLSAKNVKFFPSITAAYARGSGDKTGGDNISNDYRQTGYQDNTSDFAGFKSVQYYGEVLDPELCNLKITTLGAGVRPLSNASVELIYHKYTQQYPDNKIRGNLVDPPARPNGISDQIGSEVDIILGFSRLWNHLHIAWITGIFTPGKAFAPFLETAVTNKLNLKIVL